MKLFGAHLATQVSEEIYESFVDGVAARSCVVPVSLVENRQITTLEGLARNGQPNDVQQAFIDCQAAQCGYCLNGMVMTVQALLERNPQATEEQMARFNEALEEQQALEQWLRRVPDDPGGLLRRKFRYQTIQRLRNGEEPDEDVRW